MKHSTASSRQQRHLEDSSHSPIHQVKKRFPSNVNHLPRSSRSPSKVFKGAFSQHSVSYGHVGDRSSEGSDTQDTVTSGMGAATTREQQDDEMRDSFDVSSPREDTNMEVDDDNMAASNEELLENSPTQQQQQQQFGHNATDPSALDSTTHTADISSHNQSFQQAQIDFQTLEEDFATLKREFINNITDIADQIVHGWDEKFATFVNRMQSAAQRCAYTVDALEERRRTQQQLRRWFHSLIQYIDNDGVANQQQDMSGG